MIAIVIPAKHIKVHKYIKLLTKPLNAVSLSKNSLLNTNYFFLEFTGPGHHFESDSDIETIDEKNAESNCESLGKYIIIFIFFKKNIYKFQK